MKTSKFSTLLLTALIVTGCSTSINTPNTDTKSVNPSVNKSSEIKSNVALVKLTQADIVRLDHEYSAFSTKSLSAVYFEKKLVQLIALDNGVANGAKIVQELQYAKYKTEAVIPFQAMTTNDSAFYTTLTNVAAVIAQRTGDAPFNLFMGNSNPYPSGLTATAITGTSFTANWSAVANATAYEISVDGGAAVNVGNVLTSSVTGLTIAGNPHNFKVRAIRSTITGSYSNPTSVTLVNGGDKIIYNQAGGNLLKLINTNGTNKITLKTISAGQSISGSWAPDGSHIIFHGGQFGVSEYPLSKINPNGTNETLILNQNGWGGGEWKFSNVEPPLYFSDASKIAVQGQFGPDDVGILNPNGTGYSSKSNPGGFTGLIALSQDNIWMLVASTSGLTMVNLQTSASFTTSFEGRSEPNNRPAQYGFGFSSNNSKVIFRNGSNIYASNTNFTGLASIVAGVDSNSGISVSKFDTITYIKNNDVYKNNILGTQEVQVTFNGGSVIKKSPVWSPDGSKILYYNQTAQDLFVINSDGTGNTAVTTDGAAFIEDGYKSFNPM